VGVETEKTTMVTTVPTEIKFLTTLSEEMKKLVRTKIVNLVTSLESKANMDDETLTPRMVKAYVVYEDVTKTTGIIVDILFSKKPFRHILPKIFGWEINNIYIGEENVFVNLYAEVE
jgi:hypothetical protein